MQMRSAALGAARMTDLRPHVRQDLAGVADLVDRLREAVGQADPATALETVLATTGYEQYLAEEGAEGMERIENVRELAAGGAARGGGGGAGSGRGRDGRRARRGLPTA